MMRKEKTFASGSICCLLIPCWVSSRLYNERDLEASLNHLYPGYALLGVDKERGELKVGLAADIIAAAENPLENANALKRIVFVMKNGVVIKRGE